MSTSMAVRRAPDPVRFTRMNTAEMRESLLLEHLFVPGGLELVYSDVDRAVIGGAVPADAPLQLGTAKELAAEYFTERRELGVINIGGEGFVDVEGQEHALANRSVLYIGRGNRKITFRSRDARQPACFYFVSYPAHTAHPTQCAPKESATPANLGSTADANVRTIYKCIHPAGIKSCQLVMGFTELAPGSVWNTMPAHTHARRSEIYMYFDLPKEAVVVHCMGEPDETRHVMIRDRQAVISPSWSIHSGVGTRNYTFVWAMGGENQEFGDMDGVAMEGLR